MNGGFEKQESRNWAAMVQARMRIVYSRMRIWAGVVLKKAPPSGSQCRTFHTATFRPELMAWTKKRLPRRRMS